MMKYLRILICGIALQCNALPALADFTATQGSGITIASTVVSTKHYQDMVLCDVTLGQGQCAGVNASGQLAIAGPVTNAGTFAVQLSGATNNINNISGTVSLPTGAATAAGLTTINTTLGSPFQAGGSIGNASFAATQATAASLNATVVGTGTFATQLTGATNNINNIAGTVSLPTGASTSANQTNASQKTQIVDGSGNVIASTSNNLNVQCANCSGSGVSAADAATFTAGTSLMAPVGAQFTSGGATACVTGHECTLGMTAARGLFTDMSSVNGTTTLTGTGAVGSGSPRVAVGTDTATIAGSAPGTAGTPSANVVSVQGVASGTNLPVSQATAANLNATVVGTGTFAVQSTIASATGWGIIADKGTFTASTSPASLMAGEFTTGGATACASGQSCAVGMTASRGVFTDVSTVNAVTVLTGTGAVGTGAQRIAVGTDTATIAGSAPGTAGSASSNVISVQGIASMTPLATNVAQVLGSAISITNPEFVRNVATATGGTSTAGAIVPNNTTAVVVKSGAGTLYGLQLYGINAAPLYVKFYNATSATCGSGTPVKRMLIPAASTAANGAGSNVDFGPAGVNFSTGITYCATTGITDADTTAPTANNFLINVDYL
jgi:hypothetical protein